MSESIASSEIIDMKSSFDHIESEEKLVKTKEMEELKNI
jgi:hypothetical protein